VIIAAVLRRSLQLGINPTLGTSVRHGLGGSAANADIHVLEVSHQLGETKKDEGLIQDGDVAEAR
jgi:hypothetical protein